MSVKDLVAGDIVLEFDETGNLINESTYLYVGNNVVFKVNSVAESTRTIPVNSLSELRNPQVMRMYQEDPDWGPRVSEYFAWHDYDFRLAGLILNAMKSENTAFLQELPKLIPHLDEINEETYQVRWDALLKQLRPGDFFFTSRLDGKVSKVIRKVTHGPWSHVGACYDEDNSIVEMLPSGIAKRHIEVYRDGKTRIGLYRSTTQVDIKELTNYVDKSLARKVKYGFPFAILSGLYNITGRVEPGLETPMDLIYGGALRLITYV